MYNNNLDANQMADLVRNSPYFDEQWYRTEYPEITYHEDGNPDPAYHYANYGYKEHRLPSVLFDGNKYTACYGLSEMTNPLIHCLSMQNNALAFRVLERRQDVINKVAFRLPLTRSERILWLEMSYKDRLHQTLDLVGKKPDTFSEKIYYLRAFWKPQGEGELQQYSTMSGYLQKHYGISKEIAPEPIMVCSDLNKFEHRDLPKRYLVKCNGLSGRTLYVNNTGKDRLNKDTLLQYLAKMQEDALTSIRQYKFSDVSKYSPDLVFFENRERSFENQQPTQDNPDVHCLDMNVYCFNGKASLLSIAGPSTAMTFYDRNFELLPTAISNDTQGSRPIVINLFKPPYLDQMIATAEKIGKDYPLLRMTFTLYDNDFSIIEICLLPGLGNFLFTNDYDLKIGCKLDVSKINITEN